MREFRNLLADQAKEEERVVKRSKPQDAQACNRSDVTASTKFRFVRRCFKLARRTCRQKTRTYCSKQGPGPLPWLRSLCTGRLLCSMEGAQDGCIYNYVVSAHKPTAVRHSVVGNFTSPSDLNLIMRHAPVPCQYLYLWMFFMDRNKTCNCCLQQGHTDRDIYSHSRRAEGII